MGIKEISKEYTRDNFISIMANDKYDEIGLVSGCPETYKLHSFNYIGDCDTDNNKICEKCWEQAVKDIKFKDDMEGERVEDKTIKVKCINDGGLEERLTIGETYETREEKEWYFITNDKGEEDGYQKQLFEEVKEDILMAECLTKTCGTNDNGKCEINKEYCTDKIEHTPTYAEGQLEYAQDKENRCYNEKCVSNNKNGLCEEQKHISMCDIRDTKQPTPINYEAEYNKLKSQNGTLQGQLEVANKHNELFLKDIGEFRKALDVAIKEADKFKEESKVKDKEVEKLETQYNKQSETIRKMILEKIGLKARCSSINSELGQHLIESEDEREKLKAEVTEYKETRDYLNRANECLENEIKELGTIITGHRLALRLANNKITNLTTEKEKAIKMLHDFRHLEVGSQEKLKEIIKNLVEYIGR